MKKTQLNGSFLSTLLYAIHGISATIRVEKNMRIHLLITLGAIVAGLLLRITKIEWVVVLLCSGCVIAAEMVNTAIERLADVITTEKDNRIKMVKDISAGAVFIISITACIVGIIVFLPYLLKLF
jgi:diacylglycerol kinase